MRRTRSWRIIRIKISPRQPTYRHNGTPITRVRTVPKCFAQSTAISNCSEKTYPTPTYKNARIQSWFPFPVQICLNGREWLSRQMDREGLEYVRQDNCFPWLANYERAQQLLEAQLEVNWPDLLQGVAAELKPLHQDIFAKFPAQYYWSAYQTEWATDVVFRDTEALQRLYPMLVHHVLAIMA